MSEHTTHHLTGDLTIWNVATAAGSLSEALNNPAISAVDLGGLTQVDLAGLQLLLWGAQQPRPSPLQWLGIERVGELLGGVYHIDHLWARNTAMDGGLPPSEVLA